VSVLESDDLRIEVVDERAVVLVLLGEHDIGSSGRVRAILSSLLERNDLVVADVSEVEFIDSTIMHPLLNTHRAARNSGATFRLQLGTAPIVKRALALSGALEVLTANRRDEAVA
jgi:anti-anti-sigma factor